MTTTPTVAIFDIETTIVDGPKGPTPSPFYGARPVYLGLRVDGVLYIASESMVWPSGFPPVPAVPDQGVLLVGHNIKFDLLHMRMAEKYHPPMPFDFRVVKIWDTQIVEYLLSGQRTVSPSLDTLCKKYGLPVKDSYVTDKFKAGVGADKINPDVVKDYLAHDLEVTEAIFREQLKEVQSRGMSQLVHSQMEALKALVEIEFNGMNIDKLELERTKQDLLRSLSVLEHSIEKIIRTYTDPVTPSVSIELNSNKFLTTILYGGVLTWEAIEFVRGSDEEPLKYKSGPKKGTLKTKKTIRTAPFPGILKEKEVKRTPSGEIALDEAVLEKLSSYCELAKLLLQRRGFMKKLTTYILPYENILKYSVTGRIHPTYNQAIARTGRLTCSQPNLQNVDGTEDD